MELLAIFLVIVALAVAAVVVPVAIVAYRLNRANRIHPSVKGPVPLRWLSAPGPLPRLHRRLRAALSLAERARASGHEDTVDQLIAEAAQLDAELVLTLRYRSHERRVMRRGLEGRVVRIETIARRLVGLTRPIGVAEEPLDRLASMEEDLDALEAARQEIEQLGREPGFLSALRHDDESLQRRRGQA